MVTAERVKEMAKQACFYVTPAGTFLRMQWCEEETFCCMDEDSSEDSIIRYEDVKFTEFEEFQKLTKIEP